MYKLEFWTYIITNQLKGTLYIGHTDDIETRVEQHIAKVFDGFSSKYNLKHLVWSKSFGSRDEAFKKERQMKEWKRDWKIRVIEEHNPHWIDLHTVPVWPLPDQTVSPELYAQCMTHRLDPGLRRDERHYDLRE